MGSFVSQFSPSAEIRRDEVGRHYVHFFRKMYGKIGLKIENFHINRRNLVDMFILLSYKKYMRNVQISDFSWFLNIPSGATGRKINIFTIPAYTFCRTMGWRYLPSFIANGLVNSPIFVRLCENFLFLDQFSHVRIVANFVAWYLDTRRELRGKWAHSEN